MLNSDKRRRNNDVLLGRLRTQVGTPNIVTEAESYLRLGKILRRLLHHRFGIADYARLFHVPVSEFLAAIQYAESSDGLKLRSLVEDWSWETIKQHIGQQSEQR